MKEDMRFVSAIADGYDLYFGYRRDLVEQLVELSKLPEIQAVVPKDATRFASVEAFAQRPADAQTMYWLLHGDELAGIIWIRKVEPSKPLPESMKADYTVAIRVYPAHQGKGLSEPFLREAQQDFIAEHSDVKGFWLETGLQNAKAQHVYQKLGYQKVAAYGDTLVMYLAVQHLS